ncbi:hypothetical protein FD755_001970 [Muntiacus reevesi]|uniref:Uncharacterized protein n=2 Tax=Muntiacus TaxID=9885 RepID=A0A5J5N4S9_MUNRE|nr:hypothetical protein FD754_005445 [Muntiacus muntjak]KAB0387014.1 hypothetical protein FD755_001970 [Muntiacus reevesi]
MSDFNKHAAVGPPRHPAQSSAEQKDLSDSGEEPRGEAEAPHHGTGQPESAGEHALELPAPASALARAPEAQLLPFPRELAGQEEEPLPLNRREPPEPFFFVFRRLWKIIGGEDCELSRTRNVWSFWSLINRER